MTQIFQNQPRFSKILSPAHQKTIVTSALVPRETFTGRP